MSRQDLLQEVLSVPTATYHEEYMVEYISNWLTQNNIPFVVDEMMNIYATKTSEGFDGKLYPCMVAHTDTVHGMNEIVVHKETLPDYDNTSIKENELELYYKYKEQFLKKYENEAGILRNRMIDYFKSHEIK